MTRAVIGLRVSTEDQKDEGYGLPIQLEACQAYIAKRGYTLVTSTGYASAGIEYMPGVFAEDYTGKIALRPAILKLFEAIRPHQIEVVVWHRTNRLGRRRRVQDTLEDEFRSYGVRVEYVTAQFDSTTVSGRGMRGVQAVFDQMDYEQIVEQLRQGREAKVKQGSVMVVRPPYGYRTVTNRDERGKTTTVLEIVEDESEIVRTIFDWYINGGLAIAGIVKRLTEMRIPTRWDTSLTRRGAVGLKRREQPRGVWNDSTVYGILRSETYVGRWGYGKSRTVPTPGTDTGRQVAIPRDEWAAIVAVPAIISEDIYQLAQEQMKQNAKRAKRNRKFSYLFSGMLTCDKCKKAYCGCNGTQSEANYRCSSRRARFTAPCDMPNFNEAELDNEIWPWICEIVMNPDRVDAALEQRQQEDEDQNMHANALIAACDRVIAEKQAEQSTLVRQFAKTPIDAIEREILILEDEIAGQRQQRAELVAKRTRPHYTPEYKQAVKDACAKIAADPLRFRRSERRETYEALNLTVRLEVKDGLKIVHARCELDARKLIIGSSIAFTSSWQSECNTPLVFTARLIIGPVDRRAA